MTKAIIAKITTYSPQLYDQIMKYKKRNPVSDLVLRGQYIAEVRGFLNALETMGMITQAEHRCLFVFITLE